MSITYIIDIDGFTIKPNDYYKEVGIFDLWEQKVMLLHIRLPNSFLTVHKNYTQVQFCTRFVHGMAVKNHADDISYSNFLDILNNLDSGREYMWAYKGEAIEKLLLSKLNIKNMNLET